MRKATHLKRTRMRTRSMRSGFLAAVVWMVCIHINTSPLKVNIVVAWVTDSSRLNTAHSNDQVSKLTHSSHFTKSRNRILLNTINIGTSNCNIRDKSTRRQATVESNAVTFSPSDYDDEDEENFDNIGRVRQQEITDDDENFKDLKDAAMEHTRQRERANTKVVNGVHSTTVPVVPNRSKTRNTGSNKNAAFHDPQFLRKRTADLLKVTDGPVILGGPRNMENSDTTNGIIASSSTPQLGRHMKVEKKTFHFLLDAWAFSGESDAAEQAMTLLRRMEELGQRSSSTTMNPIQPDVRSYTKTINAISRQGGISGGEDAEALLEKMRSISAAASHTNPEYASSIRPNSYTYTAVIQAHSNSGAIGSPERAEALIERMIDKYQRGDDSVRPTSKTFNAVIHAFGKARDAERAAAMFSRMERLYESGATLAKPNAINFNSLITAWANCDLPDSAKRAEAVLERMEQSYKMGDESLKPTTVSFNAVIDAYAKSGEENAAQKAEELLRRMYDLYEAGNVQAKPNTRSFNSVINAWAKSGDPNAASNAAELLELMAEKYEEGDVEVRPDAHSFCTTINGTLQHAFWV
jgi:pentatricopeptide repeat protein